MPIEDEDYVHMATALSCPSTLPATKIWALGAKGLWPVNRKWECHGKWLAKSNKIVTRVVITLLPIWSWQSNSKNLLALLLCKKGRSMQEGFIVLNLQDLHRRGTERDLYKHSWHHCATSGLEDLSVFLWALLQCHGIWIKEVHGQTGQSKHSQQNSFNLNELLFKTDRNSDGVKLI